MEFRATRQSPEDAHRLHKMNMTAAAIGLRQALDIIDVLVSRRPSGLAASTTSPSLIDSAYISHRVNSHVCVSWEDAPGDHAFIFANLECCHETIIVLRVI